MSLTSMIKGKRDRDKELQKILKSIVPNKSSFRTISGNTAFSSRYTIMAPYKLEQSYHSSVVGTAFDYMARFIIAEKIIKNKDQVFNRLTAGYGLKKVNDFCDNRTFKVLKRKYEEALKQIEKYIHKGTKITILYPYATFLARLEHIFRSGMPPKDIKQSLLGKENEKVIADLKLQCEIFIDKFMDEKIISANSDVIFNPHFGIGSQAVGGADADIYIDGTLFDFKTSKNLGYRWQDTAQIFGYYILNEIAIAEGDSVALLYEKRIDRLAFYKSRFGEIEYIDISTIDSEKLENASIQTIQLLKPDIELINITRELSGEYNEI